MGEGIIIFEEEATLFKKWTRWVVMGRRIDSAGVLLLSFRYLRCRKIFKAEHVLPFDGTSRFLKQSIFYHLSSRWTSFPMLTRASLGEKYGIKPDVKNKKLSPQQSKFSSVDLRWDRSVTVPWQKMFDSWLFLLLSSKIDEVGSHAVLLTTPQLIHTKSLEIKPK